ncbi:MAG: radical SAM protein [Thermodesulfobacteriota bacterium]
MHGSGKLATRAEEALAALGHCTLCPRGCGVDRLADEKGFCRTGLMARVASYAPHFGEETPLSGVAGSGTIFFSNCNLGCVFCQNEEISHQGQGVTVDSGQLAAMMVSLQKQGCHNINLVTPSHVIPQILRALVLAVEQGLTLPLVYNSSSYDSAAGLELLAGVVDIYLADFKFWQPESAGRYLQAADYPEVARVAIAMMHDQVGDLEIGADGIAGRGLLLRHLLMPGFIAEAKEILSFFAQLSQKSYVNIMGQYHPCHRAHEFAELGAEVSGQEYEDAYAWARHEGLQRLEQGGLERLLAALARGH